MYRFLIVIERANGNFSAYSPDLPGCVATGKTREQVTRNMHEAIEMHVRGLREDKLPVPKSMRSPNTSLFFSGNTFKPTARPTRASSRCGGLNVEIVDYH